MGTSGPPYPEILQIGVFKRGPNKPISWNAPFRVVPRKTMWAIDMGIMWRTSRAPLRHYLYPLNVDTGWHGVMYLLADGILPQGESSGRAPKGAINSTPSG